MKSHLILGPNRSLSSHIISRVGQVFKKRRGSTRLEYEEFMQIQKRPDSNIIVCLPRSLCFLDTLDNVPRSVTSISKILANEIDRLSPLAKNSEYTLLTNFERHTPSKSLQILHVKNSTILELENKAAQLNVSRIEVAPEDQTDLVLPSPSVIHYDKLRNNSRLLAFAFLLLSLWVCINTILAVQTTSLNEASNFESSLRRQLIERSSQDNDLDLFSELRKVEAENLTPQKRLAEFLKLTQSTPMDSWWTDIKIASGETTISGISANAVTILSTFEKNLENADVGFAETVSDEDDGTQRFAIKIEYSKP